jgi:hypothetical protein
MEDTMFASSRYPASKLKKRVLSAAGICIGVLGLSSAPALAHRWATPAVNAELAVCPGQIFSQPFEALGDTNYYTLVPGGEFNSAAEGWMLFNGARITGTTRPDGTSGGVLDLPSGAAAVSPPVCVTLQYPSARVWVRSVHGSDGVAVGVSYAGTRFTVINPAIVGQVHGQQSWTPSTPLSTQPQLAGAAEGVREVRFVFYATGWKSDTQLSDLYVDPRMR